MRREVRGLQPPVPSEGAGPPDRSGTPGTPGTPGPADRRAGPGQPVPELEQAGFWPRGADADGPGVGFGAGGPLDDLAPGPELASHACQAAADLARLDDDQLVGVLRAARRLSSWTAAMELSAVAALAARRPAGSSRAAEHVADELAAALTLTRRGAESLLSEAAALASGTIDAYRAHIITAEAVGLSPAGRAAVEEQVLPGAGKMTSGELRSAVRRAVLAADPQAAIRRRQQAQGQARVERWAEHAGTAALAGRDLPPDRAIRADQALTEAARWLAAHGADGGMDALRAQAFLALLAGDPIASLLPSPADPASVTPADPASAADSQATSAGGSGGRGLRGSITLTMPVSAWLGLSDAPGEVPGFGALDAGACRDLAAGLAAAGWHLTLTGPGGIAVGHGCARTAPGPDSTGLARRLDWLRQIKIDWLETGACTHSRESPRYRPPPSLAHLIKVRQRACCFPGCRRPARRCDEDHTIPYDQGGRTCECNLSPLCRTHLRAKQAGGWHLSQPEPGHLTWTLPHGRSYQVTPASYPG